MFLYNLMKTTVGLFANILLLSLINPSANLIENIVIGIIQTVFFAVVYTFIDKIASYIIKKRKKLDN